MNEASIALSNTGPSKSLFNANAWRYFSRFYRRWLGRLTWLSMVAALQALLVLPVLYLIRQAFDSAIPNQNIVMLAVIGGGIFMIRLAGTGIALYLCSAYLKILKSAITEVRETLLRKLYSLPRSFYTEMDRDQIHTRLVQDTERIDNMSNALFSTVWPALLTSAVLVAVLLALSPILLLATAALLPFIFIAGLYSGKYVKRGVFAFQRAFESFGKGMLFVLHHMELTRIQASEDEEIQKQVGHLHELRSSGQDMAFRFAVHSQIQNILTGIAVIIILVVGGGMVATGRMTLGEFIAFYVAAGLLSTYMNNVVNALPQIITGNESMVTLEKLARLESAQPYSGTRQIKFSGAISLDGVHFAYGDEPILTDISLEISPGEITALIGPNGSGKSTIVHLVLGFYRPSSGHLAADHIDYDELDIADLRRRVGVVQQHPEFFSGSIAENICYGTTNIDHEDIVRSAKSALFHEFVEGLVVGYETPVGADGVLLSGGQCQRMAVARALLRNPRLLILDEPTNHLDIETVGRLLENISCLENAPAILIISHDPAVVSIASRIYRLSNGTLLSTESPTAVSARG